MLFLAIALLAFKLAIIASASPLTARSGPNAQRLARGLPPLPPKILTLPRGVHDPTPVYVAKRTFPSSRPGFTFTGRVQVRKTNGDVVGFLWSSLGVGSDNLDHINPPNSVDPDLTVSFTTSSNTVSSGPFDIRVTNTNNDILLSLPFIGLKDPSSLGIAPTSSNSLILTSVPQIPPGSPDNIDESAIWFFEPFLKQLKAQYINPSGVSPAKPNTIFALQPAFGRVIVVGDLAAWNAANPGAPSAIEVFLFLV